MSILSKCSGWETEGSSQWKLNGSGDSVTVCHRSGRIFDE